MAKRDLRTFAKEGLAPGAKFASRTAAATIETIAKASTTINVNKNIPSGLCMGRVR